MVVSLNNPVAESITRRHTSATPTEGAAGWSGPVRSRWRMHVEYLQRHLARSDVHRYRARQSRTARLWGTVRSVVGGRRPVRGRYWTQTSRGVPRPSGAAHAQLPVISARSRHRGADRPAGQTHTFSPRIDDADRSGSDAAGGNVSHSPFGFDVLAINPIREAKTVKADAKTDSARRRPAEFGRGTRAAVRAYADREGPGPRRGRLLLAFVDLLTATGGDAPNEILAP